MATTTKKQTNLKALAIANAITTMPLTRALKQGAKLTNLPVGFRFTATYKKEGKRGRSTAPTKTVVAFKELKKTAECDSAGEAREAFVKMLPHGMELNDWDVRVHGFGTRGKSSVILDAT